MQTPDTAYLPPPLPVTADPRTVLDALTTSFEELRNFVPALFFSLVILFAGYLLAKLLQKGTDRILRRMRFHQFLERGGVMHVVERTGSSVNPVRVVGKLVFWLVMFAVLTIAAQVLGLTALGDVFTELVSYIPSVIAAVVIIVVGIVLGDFVGSLIMASAGRVHGGPTLARVGKGGVILLAVFMSLQQLGIATDIVTLAFGILFGAVALGLALAFGLGNRELAGEVTREWYARYRAEREAIARENAMEEEAEDVDEDHIVSSVRRDG
jgi:mechanosensitive ion channel-like protein